MSDKRYFWLRLQRDFFKRHDIQIVENMPNGKDYILFYLKLLCESVDHEGNLRFSDTIPYNAEMLSVLTNTNVDIVRSAIKTLTALNMMKILDDETIYMTAIEKMIGSESEWAAKKREFRDRKKLEASEDIVLEMSSECPQSVLGMSSNCPTEKEKELEKESKLDSETEQEKEKESFLEEKGEEKKRSATAGGSPSSVEETICHVTAQMIVDLFNGICVHFPEVKKISQQRRKAINARLRVYNYDDFKELFEKAEASSFLKGQNSRNWSANFDWLIKDANFVKVLEGNYDDRGHQNGKQSVAETWGVEMEVLDNEFTGN